MIGMHVNYLSILAGPVLVISMLWPAATAPSAVLNVPVAARIISFVQPSPVGLVPIGIVYQPGNAVSEAEANDMVRTLNGGFKLGRATLRTRRVAVSNLSQLANAKVAFVTTGLRAHQDEVAAVASTQSILTITADAGCVVAGRCIVGSPGPVKLKSS